MGWECTGAFAMAPSRATAAYEGDNGEEKMNGLEENHSHRSPNQTAPKKRRHVSRREEPSPNNGIAWEEVLV